MTQKLTLRYLKPDRFQNDVFISTDKTEEQAQFDALNTIHDKITKKFPDADGIPTYQSQEYTTCRMSKQNKFRFKEKNSYHLTFKVKKSTSKDGRTFINAVLISSKLHNRAEKEDSGEDVEFEWLNTIVSKTTTFFLYNSRVMTEITYLDHRDFSHSDPYPKFQHLWIWSKHKKLYLNNL